MMHDVALIAAGVLLGWLIVGTAVGMVAGVWIRRLGGAR